MSCEFCENFDFTSVAVKENSIHSAGGSNRFTDKGWKKLGFRLFNFCPVCGTGLVYAVPAKQLNTEEESKVIVAVDEYGERIPFAIYDSDSVLFEQEYDTIKSLMSDTGVGFRVARDAYRYSKLFNGGYDAMIKYCKEALFLDSEVNK